MNHAQPLRSPLAILDTDGDSLGPPKTSWPTCPPALLIALHFLGACSGVVGLSNRDDPQGGTWPPDASADVPGQDLDGDGPHHQGPPADGGAEPDSGGQEPVGPGPGEQDGGSPPGNAGPHPDPNPPCPQVTLPRDGLLGWLSASHGVRTEGGDRVVEWGNGANPSRPARRQSGDPKLLPLAVNGKPAIHFDGVDDVLHWDDVVVNGHRELTIALVNATEKKKPETGEWCCHDGETGCSGTYHVPLFWNGYADWSGVLIAPVQDEIALRFGNGVSHYSGNGFYETNAWGSGGYGTCRENAKRDPNVAWLRPQSVGRNFSLTVIVKEAQQIQLHVMGERVWTFPMPGGIAEIKNTENYARIGSAGPFGGRRWKGELAEIVVFTRALGHDDRNQLERYLLCQYFPERVPAAAP